MIRSKDDASECNIYAVPKMPKMCVSNTSNIIIMTKGAISVNGIKIGSLFDGSAGFPLAAIMNGMTAVWASEVE